LPKIEVFTYIVAKMYRKSPR